MTATVEVFRVETPSSSSEVSAQIAPKPLPSARSIRRALQVLERLPAAALADLAERLVDRLDVLDGDPDLEAEEDACEAGECGGLAMRGDGRPGTPPMQSLTTMKETRAMSLASRKACDRPETGSPRCGANSSPSV